jgi:hypothetical protein
MMPKSNDFLGGDVGFEAVDGLVETISAPDGDDAFLSRSRGPRDLGRNPEAGEKSSDGFDCVAVVHGALSAQKSVGDLPLPARRG